MKNLLFILLLAVFFCSCEENRVPKEILIKKVSLTAWPTTPPWASGIWDNDGTGPDFFFGISVGSLATLSETINNVSADIPVWNFEKKMLPPETYRMTFFEEDAPYAAPFISFDLNYRVGDDYPNPIRMSAEGFSISVFVEYKF